MPHDTDYRLFQHYEWSLILTFYSRARLEQIISLTESIRHINPLPEANASINKQIILHVLCDIKLTDEMEEFLQFRRNQLNQIWSYWQDKCRLYDPWRDREGMTSRLEYTCIYSDRTKLVLNTMTGSEYNTMNQTQLRVTKSVLIRQP